MFLGELLSEVRDAGVEIGLSWHGHKKRWCAMGREGGLQDSAGACGGGRESLLFAPGDECRLLVLPVCVGLRRVTPRGSKAWLVEVPLFISV
jgi:hypothetical protein